MDTAIEERVSTILTARSERLPRRLHRRMGYGNRALTYPVYSATAANELEVAWRTY